MCGYSLQIEKNYWKNHFTLTYSSTLCKGTVCVQVKHFSSRRIKKILTRIALELFFLTYHDNQLSSSFFQMQICRNSLGIGISHCWHLDFFDHMAYKILCFDVVGNIHSYRLRKKIKNFFLTFCVSMIRYLAFSSAARSVRKWQNQGI